ncbi:MAG: hypothetical protein M1298_02270 [Chloroflexi bacterium]|nr:hypothetical protein [Chloroflexota bacterium]
MKEFSECVLKKLIPTLLLAVVVIVHAVPVVLAAPQQGQAGATASVSTQPGQSVTTPPVTMWGISGTQLSVSFTVIPSLAGMLMVMAAPVGRTPYYTIRAHGGTITVRTVTLSAMTTVAGIARAGPLPAAVVNAGQVPRDAQRA